VGGHEIRPNHMKVKATQFRQDAECGGSNPAAIQADISLRYVGLVGPGVAATLSIAGDVVPRTHEICTATQIVDDVFGGERTEN
jgi:hypothetical protein